VLSDSSLLSVYHLDLGEPLTFAECLHRRFAIAVSPAMWALVVVHDEPLVHIPLQFL
jgi:hypothetical protein